jgi:phage tail-like protein
LRRNISVILLNQAHQPVKYWNIERAYPVRWIGPDFRSDQNSVAIETLELAHCGIRQE